MTLRGAVKKIIFTNIGILFSVASSAAFVDIAGEIERAYEPRRIDKYLHCIKTTSSAYFAISGRKWFGYHNILTGLKS